MRRVLIVIIAMMLFTTVLVSCSSSINEEIAGTERQNTANLGNTDISDNSQVESVSVLANYPRIGLQDYRALYTDEGKTVSQKDYGKIHFSECRFAAFPDTSEVGIYNVMCPDITAEASLATIEAWLASEHIENIDLKTELRDVSNQYPSNESADYPYDYPAVFDYYPEFESGNGFFINTPTCHLQMGYYNIYSMSNGVITQYVNPGNKSGLDAMGFYSENIVEGGLVSDLKDKSYQLLSGEVKIGDAADTVKKYFEKGTPLTGPEGMTIDVPYVSVFSIGDIYGYNFNVRKVYKGVPFLYGNNGTQRGPSEYYVQFDIKNAYTIDGNVDAYAGFSQGFEFVPLTDSQTQIISLLTATDILDSFLAKEMKIDVSEVEYLYCTIVDKETNKETVYPCWVYTGYNHSDSRNIRCMVDSINGEVFYYTYPTES